LSSSATWNCDCEPTKIHREGCYTKTMEYRRLNTHFKDALCTCDPVRECASGCRANYIKRCVVAVEVKIRPVPWSDLLRQIKLYQTYTTGSCQLLADARWVAALAFPITEDYAQACSAEGIQVVSLGAKFRIWAESQKNVTADVLEI